MFRYLDSAEPKDSDEQAQPLFPNSSLTLRGTEYWKYLLRFN